MYYGQAVKKIERRKKIKQKTLRERRQNYVQSRIVNNFMTIPQNENVNQKNN